MNAGMPSLPPTPGPAPPRPIVAWSFSVLEMFENCNYKYWWLRIAKKGSDINKWNASGDREHDHFQQYLKIGLALPPPLRQFTPMLDMMKSAPGQLLVEHKMTIDANFKPCRGNDWDHAWLRVNSDVMIINGAKANYFDWKSGKFYPKDDQIDLTALMIFCQFPEVQQVNAGLVFYKHNKVHPGIVHRRDAPLLWNSFLGRVRELENAIKTDHFPKTQNPLCAYCPVHDCQYNTNKDLPPTKTC
jgi:hypothetical protein